MNKGSDTKYRLRPERKFIVSRIREAERKESSEGKVLRQASSLANKHWRQVALQDVL